MKERRHVAIKQKNLILNYYQIVFPKTWQHDNCFKERNESEVSVFDLSRASRAENDGSLPHYRHAENQKNEAVAVENSAIYAKCDDEVITHEIGVTDDYILYSPCTYQTKRF